ncbi:MAG: DNA repair protein RecO [Minisyncoccia bacterium]
MFSKQNTEALFLGEEEIGDADKIFILFTKDFGKIEIFARGIRKINAKLKENATLFLLGSVEFVQGKNQKILTDSFPIDKFYGIRGDERKLKIALAFVNVLFSLIPFEEKDENLWFLLNNFFKKLANIKIAFLLSLYYYYLWNLIAILGFKPVLEHCISCKIKPKKDDIFYFSVKEGGIICKKCFRKNFLDEKDYVKPINFNTIKILKFFLHEDYKNLRILKADFLNLKLITKFYLDFLKNYQKYE